MAGDFEPIIIDMPGRTIRVWAVADVHIGSKECDLDGFRAFLGRVMDDPDSFIALAGDMVDNAVTGCPSSTYGSDPEAQIEQAVELLQPLADSGKILSIVSGNHEARTQRLAGISPAALIAYKLGVADRYRENMAFVRVNLRNGNVQDTYNLLVMHGASRAKKSKFMPEGVDVFISGHTHDPGIEKPARLIFTQKGNVVVKPMLSITATSWLSYGGYGAAKMYTPKATSDPQCVELEFTNTNSRTGRIRSVW